MGWAIVTLHWRPADFWAATPHELWSAAEHIERLNKKGAVDGR